MARNLNIMYILVSGHVQCEIYVCIKHFIIYSTIQTRGQSDEDFSDNFKDNSDKFKRQKWTSLKSNLEQFKRQLRPDRKWTQTSQRDELVQLLTKLYMHFISYWNNFEKLLKNYNRMDCIFFRYKMCTGFPTQFFRLLFVWGRICVPFQSAKL